MHIAALKGCVFQSFRLLFICIRKTFECSLTHEFEALLAGPGQRRFWHFPALGSICDPARLRSLVPAHHHTSAAGSSEQRPRRREGRARQTMGRKSHPPPALGTAACPHRQREMFVKTKSGFGAVPRSPLPRGESWGRCEAAPAPPPARHGGSLGFGIGRAEVARLGKELACQKATVELQPTAWGVNGEGSSHPVAYVVGVRQYAPLMQC